EDKYKELELEIKELLVSKKFKDEKEVIDSSIKDEKVIQELENKKIYISTQIIKIESLINSNQDNLKQELNKNYIHNTSAKNIEYLEKEKIELSNELEKIIESSTILKEKINQNKRLKKEYEKVCKDIELLKNDLVSWEILNSLIGQADGSKYQLFVQNLTLGHLLVLSNNHLQYLSDRYELIKDDNIDLSISIIDKYQLNQIRSTNTLSGGETFLISLSLALGLSDLVNDKIKVDSLFLDEGFGTLDEESLNVAIDALEKLQLKGKTIGIISHIKLLKERISTQIKLKKDASGSSLLEIIN
ncbi:MAG: SbcC/MukB-like Walker B domain-containing protein, partial [Campylobacterota bacterium]|nr:SbcC/MukB-like Walker B domain-containing protein [Campylobacterota bacterium]